MLEKDSSCMLEIERDVEERNIISKKGRKK